MHNEFHIFGGKYVMDSSGENVIDIAKVIWFSVCEEWEKEISSKNSSTWNVLLNYGKGTYDNFVLCSSSSKEDALLSLHAFLMQLLIPNDRTKSLMS